MILIFIIDNMVAAMVAEHSYFDNVAFEWGPHHQMCSKISHSMGNLTTT